MRALFAHVSELAGRQHGRVSRAQLVATGVDRGRIQRWLADGRLRAVHRGVYAVGHVARSLEGDLTAAVLACGDGALVSHASAAHLLGIFRARPPQIEITIPTSSGRSRHGIVIHRDPNLRSADATAWYGVPVTIVPRVLLDLATRLPPPDLARACHEAWVRHHITPRHVDACIARNLGKPGASKLRLAQRADVTLSHLEDGFLKLLETHGLPLPRTNIDRRGDKVDCHWPDRKLTIELLSFRYHATRHAFEADVARRRRSNHHAYTYGDVFERGAETAADVAALLDS